MALEAGSTEDVDGMQYPSTTGVTGVTGTTGAVGGSWYLEMSYIMQFAGQVAVVLNFMHTLNWSQEVGLVAGRQVSFIFWISIGGMNSYMVDQMHSACSQPCWFVIGRQIGPIFLVSEV